MLYLIIFNLIIGIICFQLDINHSQISSNISFEKFPHHDHNQVEESNLILRNVRLGHYDKILSILSNETFSKFHENYLEQRGIHGYTSLHLAIKLHHIKIAELLISHGADIFSKIVSSNETTLMLSSHIGSLSLVQVLLSKDMYIDEVDSDGRTALMYAVNMRQSQIVHFLVHKGANINIQDIDGFSNLMVAITNYDSELVSYLLEKGSNVESREKSNFMTPLILSSFYNCVECSEKLLFHGANVNAKCRDNATALIYSVYNGSYILCDLLLSHGANVNTLESYENRINTPLSIAFSHKRDDLFRLFLRYGANYTDRVTIQHRWSLSETLAHCQPVDLIKNMEHDSYLNILLLKELLEQYQLSNILCSVDQKVYFEQLKDSRRAAKGYFNIFFHNEHTICYRSKAAHDSSLEPYLPIPYIYNKSENLSLHLYTPDHDIFSLDYILFNLDIIFDYSVINVHVFQTSGFYPVDVFKRIVYIPTLIPYIYENKQQVIDVDQEVKNRYLEVITTFRDNYFYPNRRNDIINNLRRQNISIINFSNIIGNNYVDLLKEFGSIYGKSKVLLNLHQEETWGMVFEEIRVLPALMKGLVIVSESTPYYEKLPYHEYIIWGEINELKDKINDVLGNYRYYFEKIHGKESKLQVIVEKMKSKASSDLKEALDYAYATQAEDT